MKTIAIIGAGVIGCSTALSLLSSGYKVLLNDLNESYYQSALKRIKGEFRMCMFLDSNLKNKNIDDLLKNISYTNDFDQITNCPVIIENIVENWEEKKKVYLKLAKSFNPESIYAANTSCIPISQIASLLPDPKNVIGLHFMNPVSLKSVVETVRGFHTSDQTLDAANNFVLSLNKRCVVVNDCAGFVSNRLSHLFMNEAAFLVYENITGAKEIDMIFKKGYGHSMGPLETADLIGIDTVVNSLEILYDHYQDSKYRCCPLLKKMVMAGNLGRKTGKGFYLY